MTRRGVQWQGDWSTIIEWLDELAGGRMTIPFGKAPPVIRSDDGTLRVANRERVEVCKMGDYLFIDQETGELHVLTQSVLGELRADRERRTGSRTASVTQLNPNRGRGRGNKRRHRR